MSLVRSKSVGSGSTGEPGRLQTQPILAPKPSDTTPPQITRGASLGGGGEYGRPIIKTKVEILENEEGEKRFER